MCGKRILWRIWLGHWVHIRVQPARGEGVPDSHESANIVHGDRSIVRGFKFMLTSLPHLHFRIFPKHTWKFVGRSFFERFPGWDALPKLLVHHADDGHDVRLCRVFHAEVRPQVVLQVLTAKNDTRSWYSRSCRHSKASFSAKPANTYCLVLIKPGFLEFTHCESRED